MLTLLTMHYGSERPALPVIYFLTSSGMSEQASEQTSAAEHVSEASRAEQANDKKCRRMSQWTSEWPRINLLDSWLF